MAKTQTLSFPIRLPDAMQAEALRLLDASRSAINEMLPNPVAGSRCLHTERTGPAWKQVEPQLLTRSGHGSRQERCEMEQAGRILRAQAARKQVFLTILPLLTEGLIRPAESKRPAKKDYTGRSKSKCGCALRCTSWGRCRCVHGNDQCARTSVQPVYATQATFPATYEELRSVPVQEVGHLTFAGDDGMNAGQTYRASHLR